MGDRALILSIEENDEDPKGVFFYSHWDGLRVLTDIRSALLLTSGKKYKDSQGEIQESHSHRWRDPPYLNRVIFACMLRGQEITDITGYGISARPIGPDHNVIVIDPLNERIAMVDDDVINLKGQRNSTSSLYNEAVEKQSFISFQTFCDSSIFANDDLQNSDYLEEFNELVKLYPYTAEKVGHFVKKRY